jgi:hypothetical protein
VSKDIGNENFPWINLLLNYSITGLCFGLVGVADLPLFYGFGETTCDLEGSRSVSLSSDICPQSCSTDLRLLIREIKINSFLRLI